MRRSILTAVICWIAFQSSSYQTKALWFESRRNNSTQFLTDEIWKNDRLSLKSSTSSLSELIGVLKVPRGLNDPDIEESKVYGKAAYDFYFDIIAVGVHDFKRWERLTQKAHMWGRSCGMTQLIRNNSLALSGTVSWYRPIYSSLVELDGLSSILDQIDQNRIIADITSLESLGTRYHSVNPEASDQVSTIFSEAISSHNEATVTQYSHSLSNQKSIIVKIPGSSKADEVVVLGAHLDSVASSFSQAPGADDDASGIAVLAEILRVIRENNLSFERSLEFHAYAAEEVGLIGSGGIAQSYKNSNTNVVGMMQIDMTMYGPNGEDETIWLVENDSSRDMRRSATQLIKTYMNSAVKLGSLSGGTSDHKSWSDQGFATLFGFEDVQSYNPKIHSSEDTQSNFNNLALNRSISKLALSYLAFYAGLTSLSDDYESKKTLVFDGMDGANIKLAVLNNTYLSVATEQSISVVEVCRIDSIQALDCLGERLHLEQSVEKGSKRIFYSQSSLELSSGQSWRVWLYDENHNLVNKRDVSLLNKS